MIMAMTVIMKVLMEMIIDDDICKRKGKIKGNSTACDEEMMMMPVVMTIAVIVKMTMAIGQWYCRW